MTASDLMTPDPATVTPQATVAAVWDLMRELDVRHAPVVESGVLVGMVSDRDLAYLDFERMLSAQGTEALRRELVTPVVNVMRTDVIAVELDTPLSEIVSLLIEHKVGAIPVVEPATRVVKGIVSYIDVLRALQDVLEDD